MKLFIVLAAVALAQAAKLDRTYLPPNAQASAGSAFLEAPLQSNGFQDQSGAFANNGFANNAQNGAYSGFEARPVERAQAAFERNAAILRQDNSNDGETYAYAYETENGISGEENGVATNGVQAQGSYSYTGDDGKVYSVRYTADENGFQPQGDHLPTPPPIPAEILKALEQNARDEAAGIYDDGTYSDAKYSDDSQQQYYDNNAQAINYNNGQSNNYNAQSNNYNGQSNYNSALLNYNSANSAQANYNSGNSAQANYNSGNSAQSNYNSAQSNYNAQPNYNAQSNYNSAQSNYNTQSNYNSAPSNYNSAQSNYNNADAVITTNALIRNDASGSSSNAAGTQKAYLPPFAQANTDAIVSNNALRNDDAGSSSSVSGLQNAYLPPFGQRQRNGARPSFNARDGYRY